MTRPRIQEHPTQRLGEGNQFADVVAPASILLAIAVFGVAWIGWFIRYLLS